MPRFKEPTGEVVRDLLVKIPTLQLRRVFYEGLKNPLWVKPLAAAGAFVAPPDPVTSDDGYFRDVYWPEIEYLTRVAPAVPADVVDILLTLATSRNAWVRRAVFEIGAKIPASQGTRLKPLLESWKTTGFGWRTDPRDLVSFAVTLLEGGETKTGRWLANELFAPRPPEGADALLKTPTVELEEYWYVLELPRVVDALGDDALSATAGWLVAYAKSLGLVSDDHDASGMIRPMISERDLSHRGVADALVEAVRDLAIAGLREDPDGAAKALLWSGVNLLRKLAIYAVAVAIDRESSTGDVVPALIELSKRLLSDETPDDDHLRPEYAQLAQTLARISPDDLEVIRSFIDKVYAGDLAWMREHSANSGDDEPTPEDEIRARAERYRHQWLAAIGADALPVALREELAELDARLGSIESPNEPIGRVTSWSGPNAFSSQDEMASMSPVELVAHLASWHDTGDGWGPGPSHEGQGRELSALLTTQPGAISGVPDLVRVLRPTYLRAVLQGWSAALRADQALEWEAAAELVHDVLAHSYESDFPVEGRDLDDDKDFRWSKRAAIDLLEELLKRRENIVIPQEFFGRFADLLLDDVADEVPWMDYEAAERGSEVWGALTMSLNWTWPRRLGGLVLIATNDQDAPRATKALAALEKELARNDPHGASRAVLGGNLGRLFARQPEWLKAHLDEYFGTTDSVSREQQLALTTALAVHYCHRDLYELLTGSMTGAITVGDELVSGLRLDGKPLQKIGEWIINALIFGYSLLTDSLPQAFFTQVDAEVRGEALGAIAWGFSRSDRVDEGIRDRFAMLWDERIRHVRENSADRAELNGISWCAKGSQFAREWWLPRLRESLELDPAVASARYIIGTELARASSADALGSLAVLKLLVAAGEDKDTGVLTFDLGPHVLPIVIANAISSGDAATKHEGETLMNELGARGNLTLESEVQSVIDGSITPSDIPDD